jgi:hypothetical protein
VEGSVELARQHWEEGYRRLLRAKDPEPGRYARLLEQVEIVTAELRRRLGKSFTLAELAVAYTRADRWAREAVEERGATAEWLASASTAADAAFHLYARGARDYRP